MGHALAKQQDKDLVRFFDLIYLFDVKVGSLSGTVITEEHFYDKLLFLCSANAVEWTLILSFGEGTCLQLDFLPHRPHLVWTLKRVICTHHCRTEALLCCWDSLMLLFQLQLSLSFISGFWRGSSRIAGLWEGPSTRTVRFYCEGLQLSFPSVQQMQCESKLWLNQLILSFEKRALQLAFLPQTGEDLHLLWTK